MRTLAVLLLCACLALAGGKEASSCVVVESKDGSGHGSGCCVSNDGKRSLILTNRHVLKDATGVWIIQKGKLVKGEVLFVNDGPDDIGAFTVPVVIPFVDLAANDAAIGDKVKCYGATSGEQEGSIKGEMEMQFGDGTKVTVTLSDLLSIPGDSGSGVFDSKDRLVSLNEGRIGGVANGIETGVPVSKIRAVLAVKLAGTGWVVK